jgi:hypothetical protein
LTLTPFAFSIKRISDRPHDCATTCERSAVTAMLSCSFSVLPHTVACVIVDAIVGPAYDRLERRGQPLIDEELVGRGVRVVAYRKSERPWM